MGAPAPGLGGYDVKEGRRPDGCPLRRSGFPSIIERTSSTSNVSCLSSAWASCLCSDWWAFRTMRARSYDSCTHSIYCNRPLQPAILFCYQMNFKKEHFLQRILLVSTYSSQISAWNVVEFQELQQWVSINTVKWTSLNIKDQNVKITLKMSRVSQYLGTITCNACTWSSLLISLSTVSVVAGPTSFSFRKDNPVSTSSSWNTRTPTCHSKLTHCYTMNEMLQQYIRQINLYDEVNKVTVGLYSALSRTCLRFTTTSRKSVLISASQPFQPRTTTTLWDHKYVLVYHAMCLFSPRAFIGYSFLPATDDELRLSRPGCLVLHQRGLPVQRRSPTQALTGPSIE